MAKQLKTRKEILTSFYDFHRASANYHLEHGNTSMLMHHYRQMEIVGAEIRELSAGVKAEPIAKPSAIDQVKLIALSGYESVIH